MSCPHCSAPLASDAELCPQCGFCVRVIRPLLGADWVRLDRLTDNANCLSLKEQRHLEIVLDEFERSFPQCFFAVYLGPMMGGITARDLGFWLINHGAFPTREIAKRNEFGCALVIDPVHQAVSLTLGYALEPYFRETGIADLLSESTRTLRHGQHGAAIEKTVHLMAKTLSRVGKLLDPAPGMPGTVDSDGFGLQPLRAGARASRPATKS